jgi:hypothetical protein
MMKNRIITTLAFCIILLPAISTSGQTVNTGRDKYTLLTMPYNLRPLTLYRGQFQANAGYKFAVRTQSYNAEGNKILLRNNGTGSVYHYYFVDVRYGLTNFIELAAETNFIRRGVRAESSTYIQTTTTATNTISVNTLTEIKGMGDILLIASVRPPMKFKWFDVSATGGMFLPSSKYQPQKPTNTVATSSLSANNTSTTVNYHYNYTNGYGVPVYLVSGSLKMRFKKFAAEADLTFKTPQKEGKNIRWEETLVDKTFSYYDKSYQYLLSNTYNFNGSLHYQATGWFDININGSWQKTKSGCTEYWGKKYINPETRLLTVEPGFELQISPSITICQIAGFPVSGKGSDAPFYLFTTIRFSSFPFLR